MTKQEILAMETLTSQQKERVTASFDAAIKFKKACKFESLNTTDEVIKEIERLQKNYDKRKAAEEKKKAAEKELKDKITSIEDIIRKAKAENIDLEDLFVATEDRYIDAHNDSIDKQIAELEKKKLKKKNKAK